MTNTNKKIKDIKEIVVLRTPRKGENQNKTYQGHNQRENGKNDLKTHDALLSNKQVNHNQNNAAGEACDRVENKPILFNHDLTPLTKDKEIIVNRLAIKNPNAIDNNNKSIIKPKLCQNHL